MIEKSTAKNFAIIIDLMYEQKEYGHTEAWREVFSEADMAKNRTSITERLKKSQKREVRREMAHEWTDKWEQDYLSLLSQIKQAISKGYDDELIDLFADLRALQQPKFEALHRILDELITPTRELIDD